MLKTASKMLMSINQTKRQVNINAYNLRGRKPWSRGYDESKFEFIKDVLNDNNLFADCAAAARAVALIEVVK